MDTKSEKVKTKNAIIAGAAPDTGNLGVNALSYSAAANLMSGNEGVELTILDHGTSFRPNSMSLGGGKSCHLLGAKSSKRIYDSSSFSNIGMSRRLPFVNSIQKRIFKSAKAILDISGGDSFTDLYGPMRLKSIIAPKKLAMEYSIPLILLPQTYGPFKSQDSRLEAQKFLKYSSFAFARDKYSFDEMKDLLGSYYDEEKHFQAVDVAFLLPKSSDELVTEKRLLPDVVDGREIYGFNISGLVYQNPAAAKEHYGITVDYNRLVEDIINTILEESQGDIWLIPHVLAPEGHYESDNMACKEIKKKLPDRFQDRIKVIDGDYDQCDIKAVISHCSWFCGTRMHATIASLSQAIPTVALAYSGKFQGVFESVGMGDFVVDARGDNQEKMKSEVLAAWRNRESITNVLAEDVEKVKEQAKGQMRKIVEFISS